MRLSYLRRPILEAYEKDLDALGRQLEIAFKDYVPGSIRSTGKNKIIADFVCPKCKETKTCRTRDLKRYITQIVSIEGEDLPDEDKWGSAVEEEIPGCRDCKKKERMKRKKIRKDRVNSLMQQFEPDGSFRLYD